MLYEKMLKERKNIEQKIEFLQNKLETFPEGKLISTSNGSGSKWYLRKNNQTVYLPKKEKNLAKKLAEKKFLSLQLQNLLHEKSALEFYLRHHDKNAYHSELSLVTSKEYRELLAPRFIPISEELTHWTKEPYESNPNYLHQRIHLTISGDYVRSKSEAIIATTLSKYQIPYRYECMLQLDEIVLYPDFTIRHPETGDVFYWEHFGMMDNPNYAKNVGSKLQLYISNGIIPSIHLITTYETKENPLSFTQVERIIEEYFL